MQIDQEKPEEGRQKRRLRRWTEVNAFRSMLGLQFFAEDAGETAAAVDALDAFAEDFESALLDDEAAESDEDGGVVGEGETPGDAPDGEGGAGGGEAEDNPPQEGGETAPHAEASQEAPLMIPADVGGQTFNLPADAVQALSAALGVDVRDLLRKGADYDHKAGRELGLLSDYARAAGMELPQYLDFLEQNRDEQAIQSEIEAIRGRYPEGTPDQALRDIAANTVANRRAQERQARADAEQQRTEMQQQAAGQQRQQAIMQDIGFFRQQYPEIKSSADVPQEVWDKVNSGMSLTAAYAVYERDQARAEVTETRKQMQALQKNSANRTASPGAMSGAGDDDSFMSDFMKAF